MAVLPLDSKIHLGQGPWGFAPDLLPVSNTVSGMEYVLEAYLWDELIKRRVMEMLSWRKYPDLGTQEGYLANLLPLTE